MLVVLGQFCCEGGNKLRLFTRIKEGEGAIYLGLLDCWERIELRE